jgi:hypothetical protein
MKKNVPYHVSIKGCVVSLMSHNCGSNVLKRLLVNPSWIDLWMMVKDGDFDLALWNKLTPREKSFMLLLSNCMKIENHKLHSANNHEAEQDVERLKLLEGSIIGGNINKEILDESTAIIDRLADRQMLYRQTANSLKKRFAKAYEQTKDSFEDITRLRRRV